MTRHPTEVPTPALEHFLGAQRWFAGKGRPWHVEARTNLGWLRTDSPTVHIELVTVVYDDAQQPPTEDYQVPLVHYGEPVDALAHSLVGETTDDRGRPTWVYDALHDKTVTGIWLRGVLHEERYDTLTFHRTPGSPDVSLDSPSIVIGAEQSNTSLIFGHEVICKVFRKLAPGLNPDIEVHTALAAAGSPHIAAPLGWLEGRWSDPRTGEAVSGSFAMLQEFLANSSEGWELAKTSVRDLFAEADLHADEVGGDFASEAHRLGAATAEVHVAMAATLPTGALTGPALAERAEAMRGRLRAAVEVVQELGPYAERLGAAYDDVAALDAPVPVQRVHGDYHLGQVLRTLHGWRLLDFEGEPAKPLEERRALDSPLRDVAGMLRSFDYAAWHLLADHPHSPQREYRAAEWTARNRDAFCTGYAEVSGSDPREQAVLLRAFETDKAVYEAVYEARNRPAWLRIPLTAVERLAGARS